MPLNLQHQTAAEFATRFWAKLRTAYQNGLPERRQTDLSPHGVVGMGTGTSRRPDKRSGASVVQQCLTKQDIGQIERMNDGNTDINII